MLKLSAERRRYFIRRVVSDARMTAETFFGCAFLAYGLPFALFVLTIAKDPVRIIVLILSAFFWLLALLLSAILWNVVIPLKVRDWDRGGESHGVRKE